MKTIYTLKVFCIIMLFSIMETHGQIVITSDNMPAPGDTIRVSEASTINIPDPSGTGFDYLWDYSSLKPTSQRVLEFINSNQTPPIYQIVFNSSVCNLASPIQELDFLDFDITNAFEYLRNNNFQYSRAGYAATISGIPVPMKYDSPEVLYKFPLSVTSLPDSSSSDIQLQYPGIGFFDHFKKRVNSVDGSGTLITPYGTFNTLRVKSIIYERDSTYLDSIQAGFPIIRNIIEYKWLSPDYPIPLLTISVEGPLYSVQFIDSVRNIIPLTVTIGEDMTVCQGNPVLLTTSVTGGEPPYSYLWSTGDTTESIYITPVETSAYFVTVIDQNQNLATADILITVLPFEQTDLGNDTTICIPNPYNYSISGNYDVINWYADGNFIGSGPSVNISSEGFTENKTILLRVDYQQGICNGSDQISITFQICDGLSELRNKTLEIYPNPTNKSAVINTGQWNKPSLRIVNITGVEISDYSYRIQNGRVVLDVSLLNKGIYFISIVENDTHGSGKLIIN